MKKTLAIAIAAMCCATANAQEINAVVTRNNSTSQNCYQLSNNPNVVFGEGNTISVNEGETPKEQYTLSESNTLTVLFGSVISNNENAESLEVSYPIIIKDGGKLTVSETMNNDNAQDLVIEDGGQLVFGEGSVNATFKKHINGYTSDKDNYYLIAAPIENASIEGLTTNSYDLYSYDEPTHYWFNQEGTENSFSSLSLGQGYLYANSTTGDVTISGTINNNQNHTINVTASSDKLTGFNLVGNPFAFDIAINDLAISSEAAHYLVSSIYKIEGTVVVPSQNETVSPCEGFFIQTPITGQLSFYEEPSRDAVPSISDIKIEVKEATRSAQLLDRAYVNFSESRPMDKFYLNENSTCLYIPQNGKDYAVVMANAAEGEMPINFKTEKDGTYTIDVNIENVDAEYLHLIDNMAGTDTDLLTCPSYSFEAKTSDYASRFKLVFGMKNETEVLDNSFAYISNGELIISNEGRATLQVIDVMGRIVRNQQIVGEGRISTEGMTAGVYVINLNGMTQKIVVR